ncbi:hypothetical protein L1887_05586 [Cichorium endivia]|nr:hypothetical protein L1887_05586 [Cichorium endivia]
MRSPYRNHAYNRVRQGVREEDDATSTRAETCYLLGTLETSSEKKTKVTKPNCTMVVTVMVTRLQRIGVVWKVQGRQR